MPSSTRLTDEEVMDLLKKDGQLNKLRKEFSSSTAKIEQVYQQKIPPSGIELRRLEFEAVGRLLALTTPDEGGMLLKALLTLADYGVPTDMQDTLVLGNDKVRPRALIAAIRAAVEL